MFGSIKLGNVFGIPLRLHWTFLVPFYLLVFAWQGPLLELFLWFGALFGSVLLHELGHSLVARSFGIHVIDITFWPLGGMARMKEIPENPRIEGLVALAGPAVNFVIAWIGMGVFALVEHFDFTRLAGALSTLVAINLVMGVFNLAPAFPMDGGRILRAWFARRDDWVSATERAVAIGRLVAGALFAASAVLVFTNPSYLGLLLISLFVWIAGGRELLAVRLRHGQLPFGLEGRTAPAWVQTHAGGPPPIQVEPEPRGARRPVAWGAWGAGDVRPGRRLSEDEIRDLERFRGRLRRFPEDS